MTQKTLDKVRLLFQRATICPQYLEAFFMGNVGEKFKKKRNVKTVILPNDWRKARYKLTSLWYCYW